MDEYTLDLLPTAATEDELWGHGLYFADAMDVIEGAYKVFPDKEPGRKRVIGPDRGGRLLTLILESSPGGRTFWLITGWPSSKAERTLYLKTGGTRHG